MQARLMTIGALAAKTGCQTETIRYYEHQGLLPAPARSSANYRLYGEAHAERLHFIRHCRSLDMTLDEIRTLLKLRDQPEENCEEVNTLLDHHIGHVAQRIAELQGLEQQLRALREQCQHARAAKDCGILQSLASDIEEPVTPLGSHRGGCH